jgi:hypothetical protein
LHESLNETGHFGIRAAVNDGPAATFTSRVGHQLHDHEASAELDDAEHQHGENRQHESHFHGHGSKSSPPPAI